MSYSQSPFETRRDRVSQTPFYVCQLRTITDDNTAPGRLVGESRLTVYAVQYRHIYSRWLSTSSDLGASNIHLREFTRPLRLLVNGTYTRLPATAPVGLCRTVVADVHKVTF